MKRVLLSILFSSGALLAQAGGQVTNSSSATNADASAVRNVSTYPGVTLADQLKAAHADCAAGLRCVLEIPPKAKTGSLPMDFGLYTTILDERFAKSPGGPNGIWPGTHAVWEMTSNIGAAEPWELGNGKFTGPMGVSIVENVSGGTFSNDGSAKGAVVGLFVNVGRAAPSSRPVWGMNSNVTYGASNNMATAMEIDLSNLGNADDSSLIGAALRIIGGGTKKPGIGIQVNAVKGNGTVDYWEYGEAIGDYSSIGLQLANGDPKRLYDLLIIPPDNDPAKISYGMFNQDKSAIPFAVHDDGSITTTGAVIPSIKAKTGTRFVCVDTAGRLLSQTTPCSGT